MLVAADKAMTAARWGQTRPTTLGSAILFGNYFGNRLDRIGSTDAVLEDPALRISDREFGQ